MPKKIPSKLKIEEEGARALQSFAYSKKILYSTLFEKEENDYLMAL